jgi:hypothetical protein
MIVVEALDGNARQEVAGGEWVGGRRGQGVSARANVEDADVVERGRGRGEDEREDCGEGWVLGGAGRGKLGEKEKVDDKRKEEEGGRGGRSPLNDTGRDESHDHQMTSRVIQLGVAQNNRDESQSRSGRVAVLSDANPPPLPRRRWQRQAAQAFKRDCRKVSFVRELYFVIK